MNTSGRVNKSAGINVFQRHTFASNVPVQDVWCLGGTSYTLHEFLIYLKKKKKEAETNNFFLHLQALVRIGPSCTKEKTKKQKNVVTFEQLQF